MAVHTLDAVAEAIVSVQHRKLGVGEKAGCAQFLSHFMTIRYDSGFSPFCASAMQSFLESCILLIEIV